MKFFTLNKILLSLSVLVVFLAFFVVYVSLPPRIFPEREVVTIKKDTYLSDTAQLLKSRGIIRSIFIYKAYSYFVNGGKVKAGSYLFDNPESSLRVAFRTAYGLQGLPKIKVTFHEGITVKEMADELEKQINGFDKTSFLAVAKPYEGKLFPDTYFFFENADPKFVVDTLSSTFDEKLKAYSKEIEASGKSLDEIIKMASIVEKEVGNIKDRRLVAGILWRRLEIGMPLQVDATFYYALGKTSSELTKEDLALDSPYNLYKRTGLPPTPINNPGLEAIRDTLNPTPSKYLYFLSDKDGVTHYAETLEGHNANKARYLR